MLYGSLVYLLDAPADEQAEVPSGMSDGDLYTHAILALLKSRMKTPFDARVHLSALSEKLEAEA